jgi:hypothetical protein
MRGAVSSVTILDPNVMLSEQVQTRLREARKFNNVVEYGDLKPSGSYYTSATVENARIRKGAHCIRYIARKPRTSYRYTAQSS